MDSFEGIGQFIFWALVIIYYLFSALTSKKEVKKVPPSSKTNPKPVNPTTTGTNTRTLSEILREIQAQRNQPTEATTTTEDSGFKSETEAFSSENRAFKEEFRQDDFSWEEKGFEWEKKPNNSPVPSPEVILPKKKATPRKRNPYHDLWKDRESVKRAFIASEIFNRKF